MPAEPWNTAVWPSPAPEDEVRARVVARTRTLRRRRALPFVGVAAVVLVGAVVVPRSSEPTRVTTVDVTAAPETSTTTTVADPATEAAGMPAAPRDAVLPSHPRSRSAVDDGLGTEPGPDAIARALTTPRYPSAPAHSTKHPLLTDPEGDAWVQKEAIGAESDPSCDLVEFDIRASDASVTSTLRIVDASRTPLTSITYGDPKAIEYYAVLSRPSGSFIFTLRRKVDDASFEAWGRFRYAKAEVGKAGSYSSKHFTDIEATFNAQSSVVRFTASFATLNRVLKEVASQEPPMGRGTTVAPMGSAAASYPDKFTTATCDNIESDDPDFAYRLGD